MNSTEQLQPGAIPSSIDNPANWEAIAQQILAGSGLPPAVTPELIAGMIGSAVPLLFEADATGNGNPLRGTFADAIVAQCHRNIRSFSNARPRSVVAHLVGARVTGGHPVVRAHVRIQVQSADGNQHIENQFWDLQLGAQVTVGQPTCPNCGAPIGSGELICGHCRTDVRSLVDVPLVVTRLELY